MNKQLQFLLQETADTLNEYHQIQTERRKEWLKTVFKIIFLSHRDKTYEQWQQYKALVDYRASVLIAKASSCQDSIDKIMEAIDI